MSRKIENIPLHTRDPDAIDKANLAELLKATTDPPVAPPSTAADQGKIEGPPSPDPAAARGAEITSDRGREDVFIEYAYHDED
ncbi:uncharacterized protein BO97DRAFT_423255 [Aspergillus homomorphus CBS 101889]|uniref:Uncharacterized protein n=1 Tax=Aspergillus homomorphus (strain CBS 101889) TaxID=1450537 RepID=A0A395I0Z6_ASPHC|nr:hypothetical protein BO97DRAFT_423255 [Aspergillus homomorphus CBS 101889]RAL13872.1 hypothetical protein BO97DRAFT_423255 [Aspergillus homomorphus CBS 101889]